MKGELGRGGEGGAGVRGSQQAAGPVSPSHTHTQKYFFKGGHTNLHYFACIESSAGFLFSFQ